MHQTIESPWLNLNTLILLKCKKINCNNLIYTIPFSFSLKQKIEFDIFADPLSSL